MQTCRSGRSEDIPYGGTRCRHCGQRLKPSHTPFIVILIVIVVGVLWLLVAQSREAAAAESARRSARIQNESLKAVRCTHDIAKDFDEVNTPRFEADLEVSPLDSQEKRSLSAEFANGMKFAGCGFNARNQLKSSGRPPH
jgi:hypothetical protein